MTPTSTRTITGVLLAAALLLGVIALPLPALGAALVVVMLIGAWEWGGLMGLSQPVGRLIYGAILLLPAVALLLGRDVPAVVWITLTPTAVFWACVFVALIRYSHRGLPPLPKLGWELGGLIVLIPPLLALADLHARGLLVLAVFFAVVAGADTVAYFGGRRWGKRALAPAISPGKTREGALCALAGGVIVGVAGIVLLQVPTLAWSGFLVVCVVTVIASMVGDLLESALKRQSGAKDSGRILPGHGGILDRVDSITAAAPVFALGLRWVLA